MPSHASGPFLILAGIVILALQARVVQRGAFAAGRFSGVTREGNPAAFWLIVSLNLLLGLAALALGVGNLIAGR